VHGIDTGTVAHRTPASPVRDGLRLGSDGLRGRARGRASGSEWLGWGEKWAVVERNASRRSGRRGRL
jgi:hypothetical protein